MKKIVPVIFAFIFACSTYAAVFPPNTKYEVCFTPGSDCTAVILREIKNAHQSIYIQAYSFTSAPIAKAVADAQKKGIDVKLILDKSQMRKNRYSSAKYFVNQSVPVWIDYKPAIAHNKVIIIDNNTVITGSFNFTRAAQKRNAENLLIIHDPGLAMLYFDNWKKRQLTSIR